MNKAKLTALCHKISKNTGLTFNSVMTYYFPEVILKKLSQSTYSNHYIFKGGSCCQMLLELNLVAQLILIFCSTK
ncbi:hypothetical protein SUT007_12280 [Streptococcus parasuis]|nr:hypothetical protein SUT007_12280 [Streptococcus parasuis]